MKLELLISLAKRWLAGEALEDLASEVGVSWQRLAGYFIAGGYRAKKRATLVDKVNWTHKWSITMTRVLVSSLVTKTKWKLITFHGPANQEARGVVDILAVRKDHRSAKNGLNRGDLLDIVLIQVKGGSAAWPSKDDIRRLRKVRKHHRARAVLLAAWKKGHLPTLHRLKVVGDDRRSAWKRIDDPLEVFS